MSLRDRLKSKKEARLSAQRGEYKISIAKVIKAVNKTKNAADLGNIIKEFSKFLNTLEAQNAQIVFSGDFDTGQRTLLNCILGSFIDDGSEIFDCSSDEEQENKPAAKLIRKRKSVKARLAEAEESDNEE